jgi:hypothetical protein
VSKRSQTTFEAAEAAKKIVEAATALAAANVSPPEQPFTPSVVATALAAAYKAGLTARSRRSCRRPLRLGKRQRSWHRTQRPSSRHYTPRPTSAPKRSLTGLERTNLRLFQSPSGRDGSGPSRGSAPTSALVWRPCTRKPSEASMG